MKQIVPEVPRELNTTFLLVTAIHYRILIEGGAAR
jgi:hypothetical protein